MDSGKFAIPYKNLVYILAGLTLMIIGYTLMTGGGTTDPDIFPKEEMFSFRRVVLAPVLILAGFVVEIFAIMHKPKSK
ncbi:MAG: hypothetical protein A2X17_05540 [Bacteroidetes bacterium GWF2_41_61]|nr:MAG: hypothetical protein A2X17_05540 [Bacteroidetes bacterium GWF2_41_61]OFY91312.1 MAG: hypothetical protein A2266_04760 [Bacteroidetes bacterium RIFOXYA12_FULL_40_10]HBG24406.1 DUF3098 domain-containing protein [Rikenellaceae bacterium]